MKKRSDKQNRAWLESKLKNYLWKIKGKNAYGSMKKQTTIFHDLLAIITNFELNIPYDRKGKIDHNK